MSVTDFIRTVLRIPLRVCQRCKRDDSVMHMRYELPVGLVCGPCLTKADLDWLVADRHNRFPDTSWLGVVVRRECQACAARLGVDHYGHHFIACLDESEPPYASSNWRPSGHCSFFSCKGWLYHRAHVDPFPDPQWWLWAPGPKEAQYTKLDDPGCLIAQRLEHQRRASVVEEVPLSWHQTHFDDAGAYQLATC